MNENPNQAEGEVISLNFQTGQKVPPVADGKVVPFPEGKEMIQTGHRPEPSRIVAADAQGNVKPQAPQPVTLTSYPDGYVFKFTDNPARPGTFVLHDIEGQPVAIVGRFEHADLICNAVRMLFMAAAEHKSRSEAVQPPRDEIKI